MTASRTAKLPPPPVSGTRAKRTESHTARLPPAGVRHWSGQVGNHTALPTDRAHLTGAPLRPSGDGISGTVAAYRDTPQRRTLERRLAEALQALLGIAEDLIRLDDDAANAPTARVNNVIRRFAELARSLLGCERMSLTALHTETERLQPIFALGWTADMERRWKAQGSRFRLSDFIPAALIQRLCAGEVLVVDAGAVTPSSRQPQEVSQTLLAPLLCGSRLIGVLGLDYGDDPHQFTQQEHGVAGTVAQLCATLLERGRWMREHDTARADGIAARETVRRMELFMAMASHEFRTPLTVVKAYQQLAEQSLNVDLPEAETSTPLGRALQAARESLAEARKASVRLSALLDDLLQVSSAQAGKLRIHPQPCDVIDIVSEAIRQLRRTNPTRRVRLLLPATRRVPTIADPGRLAQVVTNYLTNAFKYAPEDQPVEVRVRVRGHIVRVSVRDQGPGLRAAEKRAIWEGFYQAPGVALQRGSEVGLGVGLYICKTLIEQHGGRVGVDSSIGRGSTFWFTLPLSADRM